MLLLLLAGLLLLRFAVRQLMALLFQLPPRFTRLEPFGRHPKSLHDMPPERPALRRHHKRQQRLHPLLQFQFAPLARTVAPPRNAGTSAQTAPCSAAPAAPCRETAGSPENPSRKPSG